MSANVKELQPKVEKILVISATARDNDENLYDSFLNAYTDYHTTTLTAREMLALWKQDKIPSYNTICRVRRKCQEHNPLTRGKKWAERHAQQEEVKEDMKEMGEELKATQPQLFD